MKWKRSEISVYLFIASLTVFYACTWMMELIRNIFMIFGLFWGIFAIVQDFSFKVKNLLTFIVISIFVMARYTVIIDNRLPILLITMFLGRKLEPYKVVSVMFWIKLICIIPGIIFGVYGNNLIALHSMIIILLYICKLGDYATINHIIMVMVAYLAVSVFTGTGAFIVVGGLSILLWILKNTRGAKRILQSAAAIFIAPICLFYNYFFAMGVNEKIMPFLGVYLPEWLNDWYLGAVAFLDKAMSMRLSLTKVSFARFGVSLWGGNVDADALRAETKSYFYLDSGMIALVQEGGIIIALIFLILYTITMFYFVKTKQFYYVIAGISIALYAINEPVLLDFGTNFLILFMGSAVHYYLYNIKKEKVAL